jgi:hypothetical protein
MGHSLLTAKSFATEVTEDHGGKHAKAVRSYFVSWAFFVAMHSPESKRFTAKGAKERKTGMRVILRG